MKTVSKFIINRDDTKFLYVEKCKLSKKDNRMKYFVHSSPEDVTVYSDHTFHSVHQLDEKMSILNFTRKASDSLITELYDDKNRYCYNALTDVYNKTINDKDIHNPNLRGTKNSLLQGLKLYNEIMLSLEEFISYEDYLILDEKFYVRQKVKSISSLISEKEIENNSELLNIPVKELVRKKVA